MCVRGMQEAVSGIEDVCVFVQCYAFFPQLQRTRKMGGVCGRKLCVLQVCVMVQKQFIKANKLPEQSAKRFPVTAVHFKVKASVKAHACAAYRVNMKYIALAEDTCWSHIQQTRVFC